MGEYAIKMTKGLLNYIDREQAKYSIEMKELKGISELATWSQTIFDFLYLTFLSTLLEKFIFSFPVATFCVGV